MKRIRRLTLLLLVFLILITPFAHAQFYESTIGLPLEVGQFRSINAVAVDGSGNIYIAEGSSHQIKKFNSTGTPLLQWGSFGSDDGRFDSPWGITIDASGNVFVLDQRNNRIQKFNSSGAFISKWGSQGSADGQFWSPLGITVDASGNVYVADQYNHRIQKFNSSGTFIAKWGSNGSGDGQFNNPSGITVDASGNVYVADRYNHRIQKFNSSGTFISKWGSQGSADGQFNYPSGITVDASGNVYVADQYNHRIQKFNSLGTFIANWGSNGSGDGQFNNPSGITVDASGNVYVDDNYNNRIQKFNSSGIFISKLSSLGFKDGQFSYPYATAVDASGNVYIADEGNNRIQKFNSSGAFVTKWGSYGAGDGQFNSPRAITVDVSGDVYIVDTFNNRIQKFNSSGDFVTKWGSYGLGNGQFNSPHAIAVDASGNVYVTEVGNSRIQKFNSSGDFVTKWGSVGSGDSQFGNPLGVTVDASGNVFVADSNNNRIQKFNSSGTFVSRWGSRGSGDGQFYNPSGVTVDASGNVYIVDVGNHRIQKFSSSGTFVTKWGSYGWDDGQFISPQGITIDGSGNVYVVDTYNHRIQKFKALNIVSLSTSSGLVGSPLIITGTGFSETPSENIVRFNGVVASVTTTSPTSLTVTIPSSATTGNVTVTRQDYNAQSPNEFLILPFAITSFNPSGGSEGAPITITGNGFSNVNANNIVKFNGVVATVTNSSPTSIIAIVPNGNAAGKITVTISGQTATSLEDFIITKLIVQKTTYPEFFTVGGNSSDVSATVNDINEVKSVQFKSRGITADDSKIKIDEVSFSIDGNTLAFSVPSTYFTDPLGLVFWFSFADKEGNEIVSQGQIYLKYPSTSDEQIIPDLKTGKGVSAYQLISIPLELKSISTSSIFSTLGKYDDSKWRLFSFENEMLKENPPKIQFGKGYWFIMRDKTVINPGEGNTVKVTPENPFTISLTEGWNLVGNPYNFTISWSDVLEYNSIEPAALKFRQYLNGAFVNEDLLKRYRGAFVYSDVALDIEIPVINHSPEGGRIKAIEPPSPIDSKHWEVNLALEDGAFRNELFGFGMNPKANEAKDVWDEVSLPLLEGMSSFEMIFREVQDRNLVKDVVATQDNYSWQATLSNDHGVTLLWDHYYFGDNDKQLVLENTSIVELVDMRKSTATVIPSGDHILKFHFGDETYIKKQVLEKFTRVGNVYPNPLSRSADMLSVSVSLPEGTNEVALQLKDVLGRGSSVSGKGQYDGGRSSVSWQADFSKLSAGMYLLKMETKDAKGATLITYRKVILE